MEEPKVESPPETLSPSSKGRTRRRRRSNGSSSFEFCVLRKPNLLSADQLFSDGVLLPLHLLHRHSSAGDHPPEPKLPDSSMAEQPNQPEQPQLGTESGPEISAAAAAAADTAVSSSSSAAAAGGGSGGFSSSKRWRDIFKKSDKKSGEKVNKDKKGGIFGGNNSERVLNINIWPFRRTKSAGNGGGARPVGSGVSSPKVSSAPCSVTNSPGEFKSKKSPSRSSLVWPSRRSFGAGGRSYGFLTKPAADKTPRKDRNYVERSFRKEGNKGWRKVSPAAADGGAGDWHKARILTMNASMGIDASAAAAAGGGGGGGDWHKARILTMNASVGTDASGGGVTGEGPVRVNLRQLFTKKV